jgi:uncharacterized protein YggU (UPF0235/DUF167 family)
VDGKANQAIIAYLATQFATPQKQITITKGEISPQKTVCIDCPKNIPKWCQNS